MATIFLDMDGVVADFDGYAEPIVDSVHQAVSDMIKKVGL